MKKSISFCLILVAALYSCSGGNPETEENPVKEDEVAVVTDETKAEPLADREPIKTPRGYKILGEAEGELNKDESPEKVIVYDTPRQGDMGTEREIHVYRIQDNQWVLWHKSTTAVLSSESGGMMGDPFENVAIERGCIVLNHFGGSREKWNYTHRFRFQETEFKLIGATTSSGAPCDYWDDFDFNLSNGSITYKNESESCDDNGENSTKKITANEKFTKKMGQLPTFSTFSPGSNHVTLPKSGVDCYY